MPDNYVPKTVWATFTGRPLNYPERSNSAIAARGAGRRARARSAPKGAVASPSSAVSLAYAAAAQ